MQFECFPQIGEGLFFRLPLASDIDFEALRHVPIPLAPDGRGKWSLHNLHFFTPVTSGGRDASPRITSSSLERVFFPGGRGFHEAA